MQQSFSRLWDGFTSDKEALQARNREAREWRNRGRKVTCFTLANQMKQYDGLGETNGGVCNVYLLDVKE